MPKKPDIYDGIQSIPTITSTELTPGITMPWPATDILLSAKLRPRWRGEREVDFCWFTEIYTRDSDDEIATRCAKTRDLVFWPAPRELDAAAPLHDALTLAAASNGRPWTLSGFRAS